MFIRSMNVSARLSLHIMTYTEVSLGKHKKIMPKSAVTYRKPRRLSDEQREAARIRIESVNNRRNIGISRTRTVPGKNC